MSKLRLLTPLAFLTTLILGLSLWQWRSARAFRSFCDGISPGTAGDHVERAAGDRGYEIFAFRRGDGVLIAESEMLYGWIGCQVHYGNGQVTRTAVLVD
jgi:hypothetical protein